MQRRVWASTAQSGSHLVMLLAIADHADDDGYAWPSVPTLARKCRMQPRNANVILAALKACGELAIEVGKGSKYGTNRYRVLCGLQGVQGLAGVQSLAGCKGLPEPLQADAPPPCKGLPEPPAKACTQNIREPSLNHPETPAPRKRSALRADARRSSSRLATEVDKTKNPERNFGGKNYFEGLAADGSIK